MYKKLSQKGTNYLLIEIKFGGSFLIYYSQISASSLRLQSKNISLLNFPSHEITDNFVKIMQKVLF